MNDSVPGGIANIGDLAKPVTALIEKIADATGVLYEPRKIIRRAKAEAEADRIKTLASFDLQDEIERRTFQRFLGEEAKRQANGDRIISDALPELEANSRPEEITDDWLNKFFSEARLISDAEMQSLWSKILSGEANNPGTFSKRTLAVVATLDKNKAEKFTRLCSFCLNKDLPFIYDINTPPFPEMDITFVDFLDMESLGLLSLNSTTPFFLVYRTKNVSVEYFGHRILMTSKSNSTAPNSIDCGYVTLSAVGKELASICRAEKSNAFLEHCLTKWIKFDYRPHSPFFQVSAKKTDSNVNL